MKVKFDDGKKNEAKLKEALVKASAELAAQEALRQELGELKDKFQKEEISRKELELQIEANKKAALKENKKALEFQKEIQRHLQEIGKLNEENKKLQESNKNLDSSLTTCRIDESEEKKRHESTKAVLADAQKSIQELQQQLKEQGQAVASQKSQETEKIKEKSQEVDFLKDEIKKLTDANTQLKSSLSTSKRAEEDTKLLYEQTKAKLSELQNDAIIVKKESESKGVALKDLQTKLNTSMSDISELKRQLSDNQEIESKLRPQLQAMQERLKTLEKERDVSNT